MLLPCLWLLLSSTGPCFVPRACCVLGPGFIAPLLAQHQPKHSSLFQVLCSKQEQALWDQISSPSLQSFHPCSSPHRVDPELCISEGHLHCQR